MAADRAFFMATACAQAFGSWRVLVIERVDIAECVAMGFTGEQSANVVVAIGSVVAVVALVDQVRHRVLAPGFVHPGGQSYYLAQGRFTALDSL